MGMLRERKDFIGAVHHVFARSNDKQPIFRDDDDKSFFIGRLKQLKREMSFKIYALAVMTTHFHLLPETGPIALSTIMRRLLTPYALRFHRKYGTRGHVFHDRYGAKLCGNDAYFMRLLRYIHRNPVTAGIVSTPAEWPWSGHAELALGRGELIDCALPLSLFAPDPLEARTAYVAYASDGVEDGWEPLMDDESLTNPDAPPLSELIEAVAAAYGHTAVLLLSASRSRPVTEARRQVVLKGLEAGYTQAAIARALQCSDAAVSYLRKTI